MFNPNDYLYSVTQNISWADMDAYQHINNAVFFRYFEDVRMHCLEEIGANAHMNTHNQGPILAHTEANYRAPLIYPDTITIATKISDVGLKKFTMLYDIYSQQLNKIVCEGSALIVFYDYKLHRSCEIPSSVKIKLSATNA